jgi:hypothetical protein
LVASLHPSPSGIAGQRQKKVGQWMAFSQFSHLFFGLDVFVAQLALLFAAVFAWHLFFYAQIYQ